MTNTQLHRLPLQDKNIQIVVDGAEKDDISAAIRSGHYAFPSGFPLLVDLVPPGGRVLDLGAHIGTFSLFAAAHGYEVTAVEASARNAGLLRASIAHNGFDRVQVINQAISNRAEILEFIQAGPYGLVANPSIQAPTTAVEATTVDDLLAAIGWDEIAFIKMDIEGSELKGVAGMACLLSGENAPFILYESNGYTLHLFETTPNQLMAAIEALGYQCYLVEPGRLIPVHSTQLQGQCTVDYLAAKQPLPTLANWRVQRSMSDRDIRSRVLATCAHPHEHNRAYIGRALASAGAPLLGDRSVQRALEALRTDPSEAVRSAVAWWQGARPGNLFERLFGWTRS